jgi:hypothetical protein
MIKNYAKSSDWFVYVDTLSIFINANGTVNKSSYLSTDLSHPTLEAYDKMRAKINEARGVENYVPVIPPVTDDPNAVYINNYGNGQDINGTGKYFTDASGKNLTTDYVISGKITVQDINKSNSHIQFRFNSGQRFLLWDNSSDGVFGLGYIWTGKTSVNDNTAGATLINANNGLTLDWAVAVVGNSAYWYINGNLIFEMHDLNGQFFNVGALQANVIIHDVTLTVKSENAVEYNSRLQQLKITQ